MQSVYHVTSFQWKKLRLDYVNIIGEEVMERLEELSLRIKKFNEDREWNQFHTPINLAKSISIEVSELLECFQWSDTKYDLDDVLEELADVTNYCLQMVQVLGVDIIDIVNKKMDVIEKSTLWRRHKVYRQSTINYKKEGRINGKVFDS